MSPRSPGSLVVLVLLVAAGGVASAGGPAATVDAGDATTGEPRRVAADGQAVAASTHTPVSNETREPASMEMRLQVQTDGDARWLVSATYEFRDEADAAVFEDVAADFEDGEGEVSLGLDAFRLAREDASAATGRDMEFRNVERAATRNDTAGEGTLTLSFTWSNFARVTDDRLYVGDAFNTTDGTWLPRLNERQSLVVVPPEEYGVVSAPQVGIVGGTARWDGPYRFEGREPWIVYSGDASTTAATTTGPLSPTTPTPTVTTTVPLTTTTTPGDGGLSSVIPVALLVVVAGVSAAVLAAYVRREDQPGAGGVETGSDDGDIDGGAVPETDSDADDTGASAADAGTAGAAPEPDATGETDAEENETGVDESAAGAAAGDGIDEELLSDEERVEHLLERNGGRMKQATIVKETGWSNAKVSQLLSSMADEDRVDKLRIGRENLISFPDENVADFNDE